MDGLKYVIPMSCKHEIKIILGQPTLLDGILPDVVEKDECEGCKYNRPDKHNGKYVRIMDWSTKVPLRFIDLLYKDDGVDNSKKLRDLDYIVEGGN
jgi:hypothetical protein